MLKLHDLVCGYYRECPVVTAGSIELNSGSIVFLIGPNGSGKSTLLKTFAKQLDPLSGSILFTDAFSSMPAYLPPQNEVLDDVTGVDILDIFNASNSQWYSKELISSLGLSESMLKVPTSLLSSGESQRVRILATLSHTSQFVLLDEPLSHLDWAHSHALFKVIKSQASQGRTFVIALHELEWCLNCQNSLTWLIHNRAVLATGDSETLLTHPNTEQAFGFKSQILLNPNNGNKVLALSPSL